MSDASTLAHAATLPWREEPLAADPYVRLVLEHLDDPTLLTGTPDDALRRQRELLVPFLEYFLRHDAAGYYRRLFDRKGLLDDAGGVRRSVELEDLVALRIHSDDLRGRDGQRRRLVAPAADAEARGAAKVFTSSGTTGNEEGPVTIVRSAVQLHLMHRTMGRQIEWGCGGTLDGALALMQATPEMRVAVGMPNVICGAYEEMGAEVALGARLRHDLGPDVPIWRRVVPDEDALRAFFGDDSRRKVAMFPPPAIVQLLSDPDLVRRVSPTGDAYLDLGEDGVLISGGGLKQLLQYATLQDLLVDAGEVFKARDAAGELVPAPVVDALGLTESASCFPGRAGLAGDDETWVKYPHPLTWVGLLDSPQHLELAPSDEFGEPRLFFYVNLMGVDYLEAVVPGDVVVRVARPDQAQHGLVYQRRAAEAEGFKIREGCG